MDMNICTGCVTPTEAKKNDIKQFQRTNLKLQRWFLEMVMLLYQEHITKTIAILLKMLKENLLK